MNHANASTLPSIQPKRRSWDLVVISLSVMTVLASPSYSSALNPHRPHEQRVAGVLVARPAAQLDDDPSVTPLMKAVRDGEVKEFQSILKQHPDINARDSFGWTALYYAATRGDFNMVKALVKRGADIAAADDQGRTVLMAAAIKGNASVVKYLLENGADVNARMKNGLTVLTVIRGSRNAEVIETIKAAGGVEGELLIPVENLREQKAGTRPVMLNNSVPAYTEEARRNKVRGAVSMRILVGADGLVKKIRVLSGLPDGLTRQALISAYNLRFRPATTNGQPVEFWMAIQMEFNLR